MALQNTASSVVAGALLTPVPITPATTETFGQGCFGSQGMKIRIITSGTATNVTVSDPGYTPSSNPGNPSALACPATGARSTLVPLAAINQNTGVATLTFSSVTGVTYEIELV